MEYAEECFLQDAIRLKSDYEEQLFSLPNVIGVDVGFKYVSGEKTREIAIRVFVEKKEDLDRSFSVPEFLGKVQTDVIEEKKFVPIALTSDEEDSQSLVAVENSGDSLNKERCDPLVGGVSIGPFRDSKEQACTGTLGALVHRAGKVYALSNFHVFALDKRWKQGDVILQPSKSDGGVCPKDNMGLLGESHLGSWGRESKCSIDAALTTISCRERSNENASILGLGVLEGSAEPCLGELICKQGRSTGITYGIVDGIAGTLNVDYGEGFGVIRFFNQLQITPDKVKSSVFLRGGDSGSLSINEKRQVVGLNFSKSVGSQRSSANVFSEVQKALYIDLIPPWKKIEGFFSQVSAACKEHVCCLDCSGSPWIKEGETWKNLGGRFSQVSVGKDGSLFGISESRIFFYEKGKWKILQGEMSQISVVSSEEVWSVSKDGSVFKKEDASWSQVEGKMVQVSASADGSVWGLNFQGEAFYRGARGWEKVGEKLEQISAVSKDCLWGVNSRGEILRYKERVWMKIPGYLSSISVGFDGDVWGIGRKSSIWKLPIKY